MWAFAVVVQHPRHDDFEVLVAVVEVIRLDRLFLLGAEQPLGERVAVRVPIRGS